MNTTSRTFVASILCLGIVLYTPFRLTSSAPLALADIKTESQYKTEASRYEAAIRAISGITTMKLETESDLKAAIAILDRERPNLKFHRSKLVFLALSDSTFSSTVKKKSPDVESAQAFLKQLSADRASVLKLEGAEALKTRMERGDQADAATLRRAGDRLKEAAERIKQKTRAAHAVANRTSTVEDIDVTKVAGPEVLTSSLPPILDPAGIILGAIIIAVIVIEIVALGAAVAKNVSTEEGRDEVAECQERADDGYQRCIENANLFQQAICYTVGLPNRRGVS